jgi:hypothetical protein
MSVRIVENFWDNVRNNEALIRRCFFHHFNRHPDPEGVDNSYNNLLVKMNELNVFGRFDLNKLMIAAGISVVLSDKENSEEALIQAGIDVNKKWEQFIYKWIEQIINAEYLKNGKRLRRFMHGDKLIDYGIPQADKTSWIHDPKEAAAYEKKFEKYGSERRGRKHYPTHNSRCVLSEGEFDNQEEVIEANELQVSIRSKLTKDLDIKVFDLMAQGFSEIEIAEQLNFSQQYINNISRKIRSITMQLCAA